VDLESQRCLISVLSARDCHFSAIIWELDLSGIEFICFETESTVTSPDVLYGCETWSLTMREEHRLKVSENRVLRIFGPKRDEDRS
jgi:hypothetical protein